jgi:hypothetical protein
VWQILDPHTACVPNAIFGDIRQEVAIGNRFGLRLSGRLIHDRMTPSCVDSVVSAETETEVESTSAISSEVQSHSQNLERELVWTEKSLGDDHWDPVAALDQDKTCEIAVCGSRSYEINARCVPRCSFTCVVSFRGPGLVLIATALTGHQRSGGSSGTDVLSRSPVRCPLP